MKYEHRQAVEQLAGMSLAESESVLNGHDTREVYRARFLDALQLLALDDIAMKLDTIAANMGI